MAREIRATPGASQGRAMRAFAWLMLSAIAALGVASAHAATYIVNVGGGQNVYSPASISINVGDTVAFVNKGGYHNAVADDGSFRCARGCDGDGKGGSGSASSSNWVASVKFPKAGNVGYFCEIHGSPGVGMFGAVIVRAPPPPTPVPIGTFVLTLLAGAIVLTALIARSVHQRARPIKP